MALVTPQNWLFQPAYQRMRQILVSSYQFFLIAKLGPKGFQTPMWDFNVMLVTITQTPPTTTSAFAGFDVSTTRGATSKALELLSCTIAAVKQLEQLKSPDARIGLEEPNTSDLMGTVAGSATGMQTFDGPRFLMTFWEQGILTKKWLPGQSTVGSTTFYSGCFVLVRWEEGKGELFELMELKRSEGYTSGIWRAGTQFWNHRGVLISMMSNLPCSMYLGGPFDNNTAAIVPSNPEHLPALWAFCSSPEFARTVRSIDQALKVTTNTLEKIPFDLARWQKVAREACPHGLPRPISKDPAQWLFSGHPKGSDEPLHVALARLLGYRWPRQTGSDFPDCPAIAPDGLDKLADDDGIVCISATKGEAAAAERLRTILAQALGRFDLGVLLTEAGPKGSKSKTLEEWLRNEFFEQHCAIFHQRPFIWHIWDGHRNGFSALVNYHKLTHANLEKLTYAYLGDWLRRQQAAVEAGEAGSDARLEAAKRLQARLKLIIEGEPPYDIFVRWKPLSRQAIGWHPDLNDGVRMNIRPFLASDLPNGRAGAGILRWKPNIKWDKDRGKEPERKKAEYPWFWGWDERTEDFKGKGDKPTGERFNGCHYTVAAKRKAREAAR